MMILNHKTVATFMEILDDNGLPEVTRMDAIKGHTVVCYCYSGSMYVTVTMHNNKLYGAVQRVKIDEHDGQPYNASFDPMNIDDYHNYLWSFYYSKMFERGNVESAQVQFEEHLNELRKKAELVNEYRRYKELHKKFEAMADGELLAMEQELNPKTYTTTNRKMPKAKDTSYADSLNRMAGRKPPVTIDIHHQACQKEEDHDSK